MLIFMTGGNQSVHLAAHNSCILIPTTTPFGEKCKFEIKAVDMC